MIQEPQKQDAPRTATDAQKRALADHLGPRVTEMRNRRRTLDDDDLNAYAMWSAKRTRFMYDSEQFKYYIPAGRRAIERTVVRATQMLMPSSEYFEVYPGDEISMQASQQADAVRAYMLYLTEKRIKMRRTVTQLLRCLTLYKRCILKNTITVVEQPTVRYGGFAGGVKQIWPTARVVDPFSFYVWPETAVDVEDAEIFCEDVMMPWSEYRLNASRGICDEILPADLTTPEWPYHLKTRLAYAGLTEPSGGMDDTGATLYNAQGTKISSRRPDRPDTAFVALSEVWCRMESRWYQTWLAWNVAKGPRTVRLHRSLYPDPPYRMGHARPIPNQHYTNGLAQDIEPMQIWLNDVVNQSEEARVIAAMPPTIFNVMQVDRTDQYTWGSRKKWKVSGDVRTAIMNLDVADTSGTSQRQLQMVYGLINSIGGSGQIAEGQPMRNMPRAGNAVNNLISLGMADIDDLAKIVEQEVLTPSLHDWFTLTLAFVPPAQMIAIPGAHNFPPRTISVNDLYGNWSFRWVGSMQAQNAMVKGQALMAFAMQLFKAAPILDQQGWAVNFGLLARRIWRDSLGERGLDQIIVPVTELDQVNPAAAALAQMRAKQQAVMAQQQAMQPPGKAPMGVGPQAPAGPVDAERSLGRAQGESALGQVLAGNG